ncbi:MAG: hypothetical protein Q8S04_01305 [Bacteroidales bacterium]|nr:hypothetical protein [Bacteroidales bacterium]
MKQDILKEYDNQKGKLNIFRKKMETLLNDLLLERNVHFHLVSSRLKDRNSISKKIDSKNDKYSSLIDVTDVVGLRIITYLDSEVDTVAQLIESEFTIDWINTVDKRKLKNDQFGYKSLHYIVSLKGNRCDLVEYSNYKTLKFEIQIRTILQHSWAEIEHDLGYKGELSIPDTYKRNFNRLSALLETADVEFDRLKKEIINYENSILELIKNQPEEIELNQNSLLNFIKINDTLQSINHLISKNAGAEIYEADNVEVLLQRFQFFKINSIKELENELVKERILFTKFIEILSKTLDVKKLPNIVSAFYFSHYLAAKMEDVNYIMEYAKAGTISINITKKNANKWIEIYKEIKRSS